MKDALTAGQKAARTRKRRTAAKKAVQTRVRVNARAKAQAAEAASKAALEVYCEAKGWRVAFFEGKTGSPRTGIIDAVMFRLDKSNCDALDLRLVQLKGGKTGVSGAEIARLKEAIGTVRVNWLIAEFDGDTLHFLPEEPGK